MQPPTLPIPPGYLPSRPSDSTDGSSDFSDGLETTPVNQLYHRHSYNDSSTPGKREFGHQISNDWPGNYPNGSFSSSQVPPSYPYVQGHSLQDSAYNQFIGPLAHDENKPRGHSRHSGNNAAKLLQFKQENSFLREQVAKLDGQLSLSDKRFEQLLASMKDIKVEPSKSLLPSNSTTLSPSDISSRSSQGPDSSGLFITLLKDAREKDSGPALMREQFQGVVYWHKSEYLKDNKNGREYLQTVRGPDAGKIGFLEDENGNVVSESEQASMRAYSRTLALTLLKFGLAPTTWGRCTDPALEYFYCKMRARFPIFRYCSDNWKADTFMSLYYSQWSDRPQDDCDGNSHIKREASETPGPLEVTTSMGKMSKRQLSNANVPSAKRKKVSKSPEVNLSSDADASGSTGTTTEDTLQPVVQTLPGPGLTTISKTTFTTAPSPALDSVTLTACTQVTQPISGPIHPSYAKTGPGLADASPVPTHWSESTVTNAAAVHAQPLAAGPIPAASSTSPKFPNQMQQLMDLIQVEQAKRPTSNPGYQHITPVTNLAPQQPESDATGSKKKRKEADPNSIMRPSANSSSARNLYAIEWCRQNRGGKRCEFATVWAAMETNKDPLLEEYKKRSNDVKAAKKKAGAGASKLIPAEDDPDRDED